MKILNFRAELQHRIARRVFANATHAHCVSGVPVEQYGNTPIAGRLGRPQERRSLRPVRKGYAVRRAAGLPAGRGQTAAEGLGRRRDSVRPAERLLVSDILPRVHTEVRAGEGQRTVMAHKKTLFKRFCIGNFKAIFRKMKIS